jgi:hypothetical protein
MISLSLFDAIIGLTLGLHLKDSEER